MTPGGPRSVIRTRGRNTPRADTRWTRVGIRVGDDCTWHILQSLQQLSEEALRGFGVAPLLYQNIEYFAVLVNRAPQIDLPAIDFAEHLVEIPCVTAASLTPPKSTCILGPKLERSEADG